MFGFGAFSSAPFSSLEVKNATAVVTGLSVTADAAALSANGNSLVATNGNQATSWSGSVSGTGQASTQPTGIEATAYAATITANGGTVINAVANVTTVEATASPGSVTASGLAIVDAYATVTGVSATASAGNVTAASRASVSQGGAIFRPSPRYNQKPTSKNATARVKGADAYVAAGRVFALGVCNVSVKSVSAKMRPGRIGAHGIHNPTDDQLLMMLLA